MLAVENLMKLSDLEQIKLPFRGGKLDIKISNSFLSSTRLTQKEGLLHISLSSLCKTEEERAKEVKKQIMLWYKAQARRFFLQEVEVEKAKHDFVYNAIAVKDTTSRWGSCSVKKNFNFNWRLVMAPPEILKYVVNHEIAHLTHMDHSQNFWNLVSERYPKYKEARKWLKDNGPALINFGI